MSVLEGIRVVDFTSGPAGGRATTVLADFGADVIKVEPPSGDRFRSMASSVFWLRGKRSVVLDLNDEADRQQAHRLISDCDIVVVGGPPSRLARWGLDASLRDANPGLIHCSISGWGMRGPYCELAGYEGLVAAKAGRMAAFDVQLAQDRPVFAALAVATHIASQAAVQGVLAALHARHQHGIGAAVEASLVQALMPFDLVDMLSRQISERDGRSFTPVRRVNPMPTLNYHPLRTGDGQWIQCGNLLEHLFYSFLDAIDLLGELLTDDRFQGSPATWDPDAIEEVRDRMLLRMQERTAAEWMHVFAENGNVAAEPILTATQALEHRDLVEGKGLAEIIDPAVGPTTQIGAIAELERTPAVIGIAAPAVGANTEEVLAGLAEAAVAAETAMPSQPNDTPALAGQPLDGLKILDLSTIIAAPLGVVMLADLGADVTKIEPLGGDPYRGLLIEGRMAVKTNAGKRSICIDLKKPDGQAIVHKLVADADVLVHNFRGQVPAKLGIDYETLAAINPRLIWAVVNGYGPHGPGATRPATHPVIGACTGGVALQAGAALTRDCPTLADVRENSRQIMAANEANPDPNTSAVVASAILLAVNDRNRHGQGQIVRINMQTANGWANSNDLLDYVAKPASLRVDEAHLGFGAGYRLYQTADGWVFLAVTTDAEFERFCSATGSTALAADPRFGSAAKRHTNDSSLSDELAALFATRTAAEWESDLTSAGVGCVRADGVEFDRFLSEDPHMVNNGWAPIADHERFGQLHRWGPVVTVGGLKSLYQSAPLAGQHTDEILRAIGHDEAAIAELRTNKIVASESVSPSSVT